MDEHKVQDTPQHLQNSVDALRESLKRDRDALAEIKPIVIATGFDQVCAKSIAQLEAEMGELVRQGYRPVGSMTVTMPTQYEYNFVCTQVMLYKYWKE